MALVTREERGRTIADTPNQIQRLDERFYKVASQSGNGMYDVVKKRESGGWLCTCPDFQYRNVQCKHIWAIQLSQAVRKAVEARVIEPITGIDACIYCKSEKIKKDGLRRNKYGDIQKFRCLTCGRYFTINFGFERMKHNPQGITTAMQLYFSANH